METNRHRSLIQSLSEFDTRAEKFVITHPLLGPADRSTIQADTLDPAEFLIFEVRIVNDLRDSSPLAVANAELLR